MTVGEMIDKLNTFDKNAEILTYNRMSHRWVKTGDVLNYQIEKVADFYERCGDNAKKQLDKFDGNSVAVCI